MQPSDLFAYLAAFVTIVLALALSDVLVSLHRLLRARQRVGWDLRVLVAALYVYLTILSEFFLLWSQLAVTRLAYHQLVGELVVPTLVSLLAFAVLPDEVPEEGINLGKFFAAQRSYLAALIALTMIADLIRNFAWAARKGFLEQTIYSPYLPMVALFFVGLAVMWKAERKAWQLSGIIGMVVLAGANYLQWFVQAKS